MLRQLLGSSLPAALVWRVAGGHAATPRAAVRTSWDIWLPLRNLNTGTRQCLFSLAWARIKVLIKEISEMLSARLPRVSVQRVLFQSWSWSNPLSEVMGVFWGEGGFAEPKAAGINDTQKDPFIVFVYMEAQTPRNSHCLFCASCFASSYSHGWSASLPFSLQNHSILPVVLPSSKASLRTSSLHSQQSPPKLCPLTLLAAALLLLSYHCKLLVLQLLY